MIEAVSRSRQDDQGRGRSGDRGRHDGRGQHGNRSRYDEKLTIDLTAGITEMSSRMTLKALFSQFGEVTACWIPPLENRGTQPAYVKFGSAVAAEAAMAAVATGTFLMDGVAVKAEWKSTKAEFKSTYRDFEAKGSNLMTSRE